MPDAEDQGSIEQHVRSTCIVLNSLRREGRIAPRQYAELRDLIEAQYAFVEDLPERIGGVEPGMAGTPAAPSAAEPRAEPPAERPLAVATQADEISALPQAPDDSPSSSDEPLEVTEIYEAEIVEAEAVEEVAAEQRPVAAPPAPTPPPAYSPRPAYSPSPAQPARPAPWDFPDEPPKPSRRPLSEVLAGFMQDRNIRWGELASGILILGSAIGLVVSLREELRETLPFFPALVFMLLTCAIHAAGMYTLRRWKLRTTSRGVLVIGLLLVPINFLAACVLTGQGEQRRELFDPVYWVAIVVGVAVFTTLTWLSGKLLLRTKPYPLVAAVMGSSVYQLVVNRLEIPDSSWGLILVTVPLIAAFAGGVGAVVPGQWSRGRWTERGCNRLLLLLGLSAFAFFTASGLILFLLRTRLESIVALAPAFGAVFVLTAGIGAVIMQGAGDDDRRTSYRITGATLLVLGFALAAASVILSVVNPTVLLVGSAVIGGLLYALAHNRRLPAVLPGAWACLAAASLAGMNLLLGMLPFDRWISVSQFRDAAVSAASGLCLALIGGLIAGVSALRRRWGVGASDPKTRRIDLGSAAVALVLGCALVLASSFIHPEKPFDAMTATLLLFVVALLAFVAVVRFPHVGLPPLATAILAGALWHALFWNSEIRTLVRGETVDARWALLAALVAACCSATAFLVRRREKNRETAKSLAACAMTAMAGAVIAGAILAPHGTGLAALTLLAVSLSALFLAASVRGPETMGVFAAATALLVAATVGESAVRFGWVESLGESRHVWMQLIALPAWSAVWLVTVPLLRARGWCNRTLRHAGPCEHAVLYGSAVVVTLLIAAGLAADAAAQLVAELPARPDRYARLGSNLPLVVAALATVAAAMTVRLVQRPTINSAGALIALWFAAWGLGGLPFEDDRAVATALRWLIPIGGACLAVLVGRRDWFAPVWNRLRQRLRLSDARGLPDPQWQSLINASLALTVLVVLLISTIVTSRTLLTGVESLGGPIAGSFWTRVPPEVSYGVPVAVIVATFLFHAVTERRSWLAVAGSAVFQYLVALSIVLLVLSPHPQLASEWFLHILQAVSLGMTVYGFLWFVFLQRIGAKSVVAGWPLRRLDLHAITNAILVASLCLLIAQQIFWNPQQSAGWINEVGGPLGFVGVALLGVLAAVIWPSALRRGVVWYLGLTGMAAVLLLATTVDRFSPPASWWPLRFVLIGFVVVAAVQCAVVVHRSWHDGPRTSLPLLLVGVLAALYAIRGGWWDFSNAFWLYFAAVLVLSSIAVTHGMKFVSFWSSLAAAGAVLVAATMLVIVDPHSWFTRTEPSWIHVWVLSLIALSILWLGGYLWRRRRSLKALPRSFVLLPNVVAFSASIWIALAGFLEWLLAGGRAAALSTPLGVAATAGTFSLLLLNLWNDRACFRVIGRYLWSIGVAVAVAAVLAPDSTSRPVLVILALGWLTGFWAHWWLWRKPVNLLAARLGMLRRAATNRAFERRVPIIHVFVGSFVVLIAIPAILFLEPRWLHYASALAVVPLAYGFGAFASHRAWLQWATLTAITVAAVLLSWADLTPRAVAWDGLALPVRTFIVLAAMMFVYGAVLPRLIHPANRWARTIRLATAATCVLSVSCFAMLLALQVARFETGTGSGLPAPVSGAVSVLLLGLIAGLISIAVLPKHDPLALSQSSRMGYVYAAQVLTAGLVGHLYLSMPWFFQFGLLQFWPYIVLGLSFGGVAFTQFLAKRDLRVLAQPLFHTAAILPVSVAAAFWGVNSRADAALVMLLVGGVYLAIGVMRTSLISGAAAVVFGNLALWLFYEKFPALEFLEHPQLWLVPPALSVLVAAQWNRHRLTAAQVASLRYVCVAVIYISSTSEILISGIGQQLWPPMILTVLSVAGIMFGILMQVRAYLYLGALFLLLSMISMVSHAHLRFGHTWPWWVFGITLGVAILVVFGLFEKRRKEMTELARSMGKWDY